MKKQLSHTQTIITICAFIVLLILGSWQIQRLLWKNHLVAEINERINMPPLEFPHIKIDIENLKYRRITITGYFLHDKEIHLFTGVKEMGGESGYNIFTPLESKDGVILVDRGWVPAKQKERETRPQTLIKGNISITGMIHTGEHQGTFTPKNNIEKNIWFWIDIPAIAGFTGKTIENMYVRALVGEDKNNILPIAGKSTIEIRNDHLEYAIIWYSLAIILLVIYVIYTRSGKKIRTQKA